MLLLYGVNSHIDHIFNIFKVFLFQIQNKCLRWTLEYWRNTYYMNAVVMKYLNNIKNTDFDVYIFTTITGSIPLLVDY